MEKNEMTFRRFAETYSSLLKIRNLDIQIPAVAKESYHDAVLRQGIRGEGSFSAPAKWDEVIDAQLYQLKLYLRNFWGEMLLRDRENKSVDVFMAFFRESNGLILFMGTELFAFIEAVCQTEERIWDHAVDLLLQHEENGKILQAYHFDGKLHQRFAKLMTDKILHFDDSLAYTTDYLIFFHWMPQWREKYSDVWEAISVRLSEMKKSGLVNLRCLEHQRLYDLYCSEN